MFLLYSTINVKADPIVRVFVQTTPVVVVVPRPCPTPIYIVPRYHYYRPIYVHQGYFHRGHCR